MDRDIVEAIAASLRISFAKSEHPPTDEELRSAARNLLKDSATLAVFERGATALLSVKHTPGPLFERRPAPTARELWSAHPELAVAQFEALVSGDPEARKWALTEQPTFSPDASFDELPDELIRQCCPGKTCGATVLEKCRIQPPEDGSDLYYGYVRKGNGDPYFYFDTLEKLLDHLNDPSYWPNGW